MRRVALGLCTIFVAAGCTDYTGPSSGRNLYALVRVGAQHLPVPLDPSTPTLLLADTFRLTSDRSRRSADSRTDHGDSGRTGRKGGPIDSCSSSIKIDKETLVFDNCPIGSYCLGNLVYAPRVFQIVGDSLFETVPVGIDRPPHVYGRVK